MARKIVAKKKKKATSSRKKLSSKPVKKGVKKAKAKRKKKVSALPQGYNNITPYLIISQAAKAMEFYKKVFGAKEVMRLTQPDGRIAHAELKIGDTKIMLTDECPELGGRSPQSYGGSPISIYLYVKDVDKTAAKAVSAGAKLMRAVENMFYGDRCGMLQDPFGHTWWIATHVENVTPAKVRKRAAEMFGH